MIAPAISIIIPTRNEAANLPRTLAALDSGNTIPREIIVVDAGSTDGTASTASKLGCRILPGAPASRPVQLNLGAREANAPVLLFLHADTLLPAGGLDIITATLDANNAIAGGAFARQFDSPSLFLKLTCRLATLRSRWCGLFLGDQAMFTRQTDFEQLGGFDEALTGCEDLDLSRRLRKHGPTTVLTPPVLSSARRFDSLGPLRTTLRDLTIAIRFLAT